MPRLVQRLLIKQAARPRALQAGMVSFKTTQLLVVGKTLLKHRANHLIHFQVLFDAKYANMLLECPAEIRSGPELKLMGVLICTLSFLGSGMWQVHPCQELT